MSKEISEKGVLYDIDTVRKVLPHRPPFLLIDRVIHLDREKRIIEAVKNVTINEPFFDGHFPDYPVMPGVLIIEALAQAGAVMALTMSEQNGKIVYLAGIDKARFKQQVRPGDCLVLKAEWTRQKGPIGWAQGKAYVDNKVVAYADIMFAFGS